MRYSNANVAGRPRPYTEAKVASSQALAACTDLGAPQLLRSILIEQAYCDTTVGDLDGGLASLDAAARVEQTTPDPMATFTLPSPALTS